MELIRKPGQNPVMKINRKNGVDYLTFWQIERCEAVRHLMSTRTGGVSEGDLSSMNLSYARGDKRENVDENFRRIAALLECDVADMVFSHQTHTTNIRRVTGADRGKGILRERDYQDVDGLITDEPGVVLATFYADCVPLLLVDPVRRCVGLSHSGWRGTAGAMGAVTARAMQEAFGSRPEDLLAGIGPSICRDCYEVSEDVAKAFRELFSRPEMRCQPIETGQVLEDKGNGKFQLDLWKANEAVLLGAGLLAEHISVTDICTCCNSRYLFSHRATGGKRGNLGMFVVLNR